MMFIKAEMKAVNQTCSAGFAGRRAIVPKFVAKVVPKSRTVLDFGAGSTATHTTRLINKGLRVTAHEFGDNIVEGVHDPGALQRKYHVVFASNVLNVQGSTDMLRKTLRQIAGVTKELFVFNYPRKPRKIKLSQKELLDIVNEFFTVVMATTEKGVFVAHQ